MILHLHAFNHASRKKVKNMNAKLKDSFCGHFPGNDAKMLGKLIA